jgi:hypothetical protein
MSRTAATVVVVAATLAVLASAASARAKDVEPAQSLTDIDELYWQVQLYQRVGPVYCLDYIAHTFLVANQGTHSVTCQIEAGKQVVIPIVTIINSGTNFVGFLPLYAGFTVNNATDLSFSIDGSSEPVTAEWRGPTPIFLASAIEGQSPFYAAADGYFTVRTFRPGTYVVHTTGCLPAETVPFTGHTVPAACYDTTYNLIVQ